MTGAGGKAARRKIAGRALLCVAAFLMGALPAAATTEEDFVFVSAMPAVEGTLERRLTQRDPAAGLSFTYKIYRLDSASADLVTYVTAAACDRDRGGEAEQPFITALRIQPHKPQSFAAATLFDLFTDVYVADREGRIRLYRNMTGGALTELSRRFQPLCPGV